MDPVPFFTFDPRNAWAAVCQGVAPDEEGGAEASPAGSGPGAIVGPTAVPPPPGLAIAACPNPAPAGAREISIQFRLEVRTPGVNLAIVDQSGAIIRRLLENTPVEVDRLISVSWLLEGVPPGDYRAYFRAGDLETSGDLHVD